MTLQRPQPLGEQVASALQRSIVTGEQPAGTVLTEDALAEQFSVSRGPVRDAFRILEQQHLVERSGRSYMVIGLGAVGLDEIYRLRSAIETIAWTYLKDTDADIRELETAIMKMRTAAGEKNPEAFAKADIDFHSVAVRLSGKRRVVAMWDQIEPSIRLILQVTNLVAGDFDEVFHRHEELLLILQNGTARELEDAVTEHIANSRHILP